MFGHQDDPQQPQTNGYGQTPVDNTYAGAPPIDPRANPPLLEPQAADGFTGPARPVDTPAFGAPAAAPVFDAPAAAPVAADVPAQPAGTPDGLLDIKQQALQQLSPLVGHLEQSPEEKFRTTMMMIQASDNQALLKDAYEAANQIGDEKTRAQALLDVINEINYFTQAQNN